MVMIRIAHLSPRPYFRPVSAKKALIITMTLTFLGLLGVPPCTNGQSAGQTSGVLSSPQQQFPGQNRLPRQPPSPESFPKNNQKREKALMDSNFKKLKQHAHDLAELAKSLQTEIEKSNENVLSLEIVKKAEQAEKLARKIKNEAKGL
jgi:hypothetical protein